MSDTRLGRELGTGDAVVVGLAVGVLGRVLTRRVPVDGGQTDLRHTRRG